MKARTQAALVATTLATLVTSLSSQDPKAPAGGFPILKQLDQLVTYSDAYRTRVDVRLPSVTAGPKGWPVALVFHGGGGNRKRGWVVTRCERLARFGYVSIAYDTGGNGETQRLNPPGRRDEALRIRDIVEVLRFVESKLGGRMDETRLCSSGKSGGGKHALWTAAFSGRALPKPSAIAPKMPVFRAAHSDIQVIDPTTDFLPGGNSIKGDWAAAMYDKLGVNDPITRLILAQDWPKLVTYMDSNIGLGAVYPLLKTSEVPLFISYAWDDTKHFANVNADAIPQLKRGVPRRLAMLTGGHGSQSNTIEIGLRNDMVERWMDRFAKGEKNGIDREPFAEIAVIPDEPSAYRNARTPWKHRQLEQWPPAAARTSFYLRSGGVLSANAATSTETGPTLRHRVASGYDMLAFMRDQMKLSQILQSIPFRAANFDSAPLTRDTELLGRTTVTLDVRANRGSFQMQAALYDVAPSGGVRFITCGHAAKWKVAPGRHRLEIQLADTAYVIAKGHRLRIALENLNVRRQPGNAHLYVAPYFESVDMAVQIDAAFTPRVEVPIRAPETSLMPRHQSASAAAGIDSPLRIDGEAGRAGRPYMLLVSSSGTTPGVLLPPRIPLVPDAWTQLGIDLLNTPVFDSFFGRLDAQGQANARFRVPARFARPLAGLRLSVAALVFGPGASLDVSAAVEITIRP